MPNTIKKYSHSQVSITEQHDLSPRKSEVLHLAAQGLTEKQIAAVLGISPETAKAHLNALRDQFSAANRVDLVSQAWAHGVLKASARAAFCLFGGISAMVRGGKPSLIETHFYRAQARLRTRKAVGVGRQKSAVAALFFEPTTGDSGYYEIPAYLRKRMNRQDLDGMSRLAAYADRMQAFINREAHAA